MEDRPEPGKVYRLTGGYGVPAISNGNTWAESVVEPPTAADIAGTYTDAEREREALTADPDPDRCPECGTVAPCDCRVYLVEP